MFNHVRIKRASLSRYQFFKQGDPSELYKEVQNLYYRGLCWPLVIYSNATYTEKTRFCKSAGPEILTFTQATLYAPLFLISMVFLPSILYILIVNINIFGFKKFLERFFENPLLFIFPLFTSFSFNKIVENTPEDITKKKHMTRANSMPIINSDITKKKNMTRTNSMPMINSDITKKKDITRTNSMPIKNSDITKKKNMTRANYMQKTEKGYDEVYGTNLTFETETPISKIFRRVFI